LEVTDDTSTPFLLKLVDFLLPPFLQQPSIDKRIAMNQLVNKARTIVSADKFRFTKDGFNLDLVYVTPRIIGTFFPNKKFYSKR
jgi:hypothetical protein